MTDTLRGIDEAIQRHVSETMSGKIPDAWIIVVHAQSLGDDHQVSNYTIITSDTQPHHVDAGLIEVGKAIIRESWDAALNGDED